ncbi:MAG: hypothetical protein EBU46_00045 [Nitrosomonadaceae bacterium]|nr:hypothetical protein [Nitrosomonadaceae bacterium]
MKDHRRFKEQDEQQRPQQRSKAAKHHHQQPRQRPQFDDINDEETIDLRRLQNCSLNDVLELIESTPSK